MKKLNWIVLLFMLCIPLVSADVHVAPGSELIYFFPVVIIIEVLVFWMLANKSFKIKVSFWKSLLIVFIANMVTSIIGIFIETYMNFASFIFGFVLSFLIEFIILLLFFINKKVKRINLFLLSIIINLLSYLAVILVYMSPCF